MSTHWAELHRQVCFGESGKKIIWQPRIGCWFHDKIFENEPFPAPFTDMSWVEIYRELNCSARLYGHFNPCFKPVYPGSIHVYSRELNETDTELVCEMPVGTLTTITRRTESSLAKIIHKREIVTEDDLKLATWRAQNTTWAWDQKMYDQAVATVGDLGAATMYMPRVTVQDLYINTMGTQSAIYAVYDWPDTVRAYFRALDESHDRMIDVINPSPVEIINFGDNLHCGTLPPDLFRELVLPSYQARCEKLHRGGKFISAHWDGDTRTLLPLAHETGLDAIEAITPQPQGDVTLEEMRDKLGDDMFLLDGIPAIYFNTTFPESVLTDCVQRLIELFAPRLVLGISDEISSTGDMERVRLVAALVEEYNAGVDGNTTQGPGNR
ncbi:MAG: hypothetical protein KAI66_08130 [Lentisphaeria bacterium]|nr:hypothetical protein [Lentisphaeria bacterium]